MSTMIQDQLEPGKKKNHQRKHRSDKKDTRDQAKKEWIICHKGKTLSRHPTFAEALEAARSFSLKFSQALLRKRPGLMPEIPANQELGETIVHVAKAA